MPTGKLGSFSSAKVARMESAVKEKIEIDLKLAMAVALVKRGLHSGCSEMEGSPSRKKVITSRMAPQLVFDTSLITRNHSRDKINDHII